MWTDEEVSLMKELVEEGGLSAGAIADRLGKTRNAVIGKLSRIGVTLPGATGRTGPRKPTEAFQRREVQPYQPPAPKAPTPARLQPRDGPSLFKTCQWPSGDPRGKDFKMCGGPIHGSSPYCEEHYHRSYQPRSIK